MIERSGDSSGAEFVPVVFDQDDTEFVMQAISISGFRYKERVEVLPAVGDGEKLEITNDATAGFVKACLMRRLELSENLIAAHRRGLERIQEYGLPVPGVGQQQRIRDSIERSKAICATAHLLALTIDMSLEK